MAMKIAGEAAPATRSVPIYEVVRAAKSLGLTGRMIGGTRYWTLQEVQKIEKEVERAD